MVDGVCTISSSGYGDGCYHVYSYREKENGYAVGAEIIFIDDYDEEDEWDGEYDDDEYFAFREECRFPLPQGMCRNCRYARI